MPTKAPGVLAPEFFDEFSGFCVANDLIPSGLKAIPDLSFAGVMEEVSRHIAAIERSRGYGQDRRLVKLCAWLSVELGVENNGSAAELVVNMLTRLPNGHRFTPAQRVRLFTLAAESIRLFNDGNFAAWATGNHSTREKHNGSIKPGGDNDQTIDWVLDYMSGMHGNVCPLDMTQMQAVLDFTGYAVPGFEADGTWGDLSVASVENGRGVGHANYAATNDKK